MRSLPRVIVVSVVALLGACDQAGLTDPAEPVLVRSAAVVLTGAACGSTVTADATLSGDVSCAGPGFVLASGVTLDCANYTITYANSEAGVGLDLANATGAVIRNCKVAQGNSNFANAYGVRISGGSGNTVEDTRISTTGPHSHGVLLSLTTRNRLLRANITTTGGGQFGTDGINFAGGSDNVIEQSFVRTVGTGSAVRLTDPDGGGNFPSNRNVLRGNTLIKTPATGRAAVDLVASHLDNLIIENTITTSTLGVSISIFCDRNTVQGNTITSTYGGIAIISIANGNTIRGNTINSSLDAGIFLHLARNTRVENNLVSTTGNNTAGIELAGSTQNTVADNTVTTSGTGSASILLRDRTFTGSYASNDNQVLRNRATHTTFDGAGIRLQLANSNLIDQNMVRSGAVGVRIENGSANRVRRNDIDAASSGITTLHVRDSEITGNDVAQTEPSANSPGIYIAVTTNSSVTDNVVSTVGTKAAGIWFQFGNQFSGVNTVTSNRVSTAGAEAHGIVLEASVGTVITRNEIDARGAGLSLRFQTRNNTIHSNRIKAASAVHTQGYGETSNVWNVSKTPGTSIVGGPFLGGNYWANHAGTGFSETCADADFDALCDAAFTLTSTDQDALPLTDLPTDTSPPVITPNVVGTLGGNGWYTTDVQLSWTVTDPESPFSSAGCGPASVTTDTHGVTFTCSANSAGGSASRSVTLKRDATAPLILFSGNAGTYTVDQTVSIICSASDATSGLDSSSCPAANGPAYSFGLGATTLSASARDRAGNAASRSTTFTVQVSFASLCALTRQFVSHNGIANSLCAKLNAAESAQARGDANAKRGQLGAYVNEVQAQSGKVLSAAQAAVLTSLAEAL